MSHELVQFRDGSTAFVAGNQQDAWHQLGTVLPAGLSAWGVMTFAHLGGWDVRKREIQTVLLSQDGATATTIDGKYVTVRTNPVTAWKRSSACRRAQRRRRGHLQAVPERGAHRLPADHDRRVRCLP